MHEFSIVSGLVESVLEFVQRHQIKRVILVRLSVGELMHLETEQLQFSYTAITKETALADSELEVESVPARVSCPYCCYAGPPKYWEDAACLVPVPTLQCPQCGKAAEAAQGHDCAIKNIKYVT